MRESQASFDLDPGRVEVRVEYLTDRFHRVSAIWVPRMGDTVHLLKGFDTYLDGRERSVVSAEHVARTTSPLMFAHTLNGRDHRALRESGVIS